MHCLSPTGVCSFFVRLCRGAPVAPDASCRRGISFFARPKKETKKSPGMRFPVPDYRRIGKSHIPGSAAFTRTSTPCKKPGVLFKSTVKWQGFTLRPLGRAGRSLPQRRPAKPIAHAIVAFERLDAPADDWLIPHRNQLLGIVLIESRAETGRQHHGHNRHLLFLHLLSLTHTSHRKPPNRFAARFALRSARNPQ